MSAPIVATLALTQAEADALRRLLNAPHFFTTSSLVQALDHARSNGGARELLEVERKLENELESALGAGR